MNAIEVESLTKKFNGFTAVDALSFAVPSGELFGLLGPNGAGKTTTINMLATLLKPTSGQARIAGFDLARDRDNVRKSIGIVFQDPALDVKLTGRENLDFHAMMYNLDRDTRRKRIAEVLELVDLTDKAKMLVEKYSGGMKRRLEIARGLIHRPKVMFLDEPTLGLDAQTRRHIWDYIRKLNKDAGVSIILTTHYMEEADYLCSRIAIMDAGKFAALDVPARLKDVLGGDVVCLEMQDQAEVMRERVQKLPWVKRVKLHGNELSLTLEKGDRRIPELITLAHKIEATVASVNLHKPSLEDVFLHFTGRTIREQDQVQNERHRPDRGPHGRRR